MRESLLQLLRGPECREPLKLYEFERAEAPRDGEADVIEGILLCTGCSRAYPITRGVPVMLDSSFTREFLDRHAERISRDETLSRLSLCAQAAPGWSFSAEWEAHLGSGLIRTWGWTVEERMQQCFLETGTEPTWWKGKLILDAGCGNGQLSEGLSTLGATLVALDYSTSVFGAERQRESAAVHFVQGDLQAPPFESETFDLIISNGVLHHTANTHKTFCQVARLVKPGGRFYLWLYRRPGRFVRRYCLYPILDAARVLVARAPHKVQALSIKAYALALMIVHETLGKSQDISWHEWVVAAYDALTPLWRHYHTPLEVAYWFFLSGYSAPTLTHWDNPYGFGMVARREPRETTPGVNFGKAGTFGRAGVLRRYWN